MIQDDELDALFPERVADEVWIELCGRVPRPGFHSASITELRDLFERWKRDAEQLGIVGRKSFWDAKADALTKLVEAEQVTCDIHEEFLHGNVQDLLDDVEAECGLADSAYRHKASSVAQPPSANQSDPPAPFIGIFEWHVHGPGRPVASQRSSGRSEDEIDRRSPYKRFYEWMARRHREIVATGVKKTPAYGLVVEAFQEEKGKEFEALYGHSPDSLSFGTVRNAVKAMDGRS